jgi:hypothetical protein
MNRQESSEERKAAASREAIRQMTMAVGVLGIARDTFKASGMPRESRSMLGLQQKIAGQILVLEAAAAKDPCKAGQLAWQASLSEAVR